VNWVVLFDVVVRLLVNSEAACSRITVVLLQRHIAYLDRIAVDMRLRHGKIVRRDALVRAFVEASMRRGVDLSDADSFNALVTLLRQ
jgi:hypothetical protein